MGNIMENVKKAQQLVQVEAAKAQEELARSACQAAVLLQAALAGIVCASHLHSGKGNQWHYAYGASHVTKSCHTVCVAGTTYSKCNNCMCLLICLTGTYCVCSGRSSKVTLMTKQSGL